LAAARSASLVSSSLPGIEKSFDPSPETPVISAFGILTVAIALFSGKLTNAVPESGVTVTYSGSKSVEDFGSSSSALAP
jgi:hypothetical protein